MKIRTGHAFIISVCLTVLLVAASARGADNPATTLWFTQPATGFDQSLVLGNGRIGAMVYGGTDEETIVLNESSVWSGSHVDNDVPGGYQYLQIGRAHV